MQVWSGDPARLSDVADNIPLAETRSAPNSTREAIQVCVVGAITAVMADHYQITVSAPATSEFHDAVAGCLDPRSRRSSVVDPAMRTPLLKNGMVAKTKAGADSRELDR